CTKCWRWGHTSRQCASFADACPLCGGAHVKTEHAKHALCCVSVGLKGGVVPAVCPDAHYYCPNCKVNGHGPSDKINCRFWKHNRDKEWIAKRRSEAES
ncbi:hypothetical protein FOMPIDRAFT_11491, partial [Fomitopsis schrenkii]